MRKYIKKIILFILFLASLFILGHQIDFNLNVIAQDDFGVYSNHKFDELPELDLPDQIYLTYTEFRNQIGTNSATISAINLVTWDKIIRFDTAEELFRFSMDVSYNLKYTSFETKLTSQAIEKLLSLHYVLGRDIDYSVMKSKQFNPIGYDFYIEDTHYYQTFKGTFDGNGFEISNLYFSGNQQLTESLYEGTEFEIEISYVDYYSMFAYNEGTIQNLGLINPTFEFNFESSSLFKAANLVGLNMENGNVNHVYVIDYRPSALVSGIRMVASSGKAAGVLFDNYGEFNNAYFVGRVVVNASYGSRFEVQPVLFQNHSGGNYEYLAFDDTLYQEVVTIGGSSFNITIPNSYAESMTTQNLRTSNSVLGTGWYFYPFENNPNPKYPSTLGLNLVSTPLQVSLSDDPLDFITLNTYYEIYNALDLVAFSKILNYTRGSGLTPFREMNYVIKDNIDMSTVAPNSYKTPSVEFSGVFTGINDEVYIYGLEIVNGNVSGSYYSGMFGILLGSVYNLMFYESSILLNETNDFAGVPTYVGLIAGEMNQGVIRNVLAEVVIDLGHDTLGEMYVGGLVGIGSGHISSIYVKGLIKGNQDHIYRTDILINPTYKIGGVVGSSDTNRLVLLDVFNEVNIESIGTTSNQMTVSKNPEIFLGGVIGYVNQGLTSNHLLGLLTNKGKITVNEIISQHVETTYVGGVIGMSTGYQYNLNLSFGKFKNMGEIDVINRGTNIVNASSVLISNHIEQTEFVHLFNQSTGILTYYTVHPISGVVTGSFNNLNYTTLVYNIGAGITLSQAKNFADIDLYGATDYSGIYVSTTNQQSLLRFVENVGNITVKNQTIAQNLSVAGITVSENISFLNVTYDGNIHVFNNFLQTTGSNKELFVAGITKVLTQGRYIKNGLVNGSIIVGGITTNTSNLAPRNNIFIGGFVNYNRSGNMDPNGNLAMPKATIGIINSINSANLTSTYNTSIKGIIGHANLFAGGIATFNDGDIQDTANMGYVLFENLSNVDTSNVQFSTNLNTGGAATKIRYGIIAGGVSAAVLSSKSRIYDTLNKGMITALSKNFARAGGILASAAFLELEVANIELFYTTNNNNIRNSILSNCINYGDISAITITISNYTNSNTNQSVSNIRYDSTQPVIWSGTTTVSTRTSTNERPGINAAAGGVIGYGLSVMRRMVNHGQVSSTDVAGGVVGATFVLTTEYVKIDTAINYGRVRAFDRGSANSNYNAVDILDYETIRDSFYDVNSTFIFPETRSDIRLFPENKRGFGGIFGRLQRAQNQIMYGNNDANSTFNFIVNMDPNVDLIGRLDQVYNYTSSVSYFDFTNATYYSARKNDTTQSVFTGYNYFYRSNNPSNITRRVHNIQIQSRKYEYTYNSSTNQWIRTTYQRVNNRTEVRLTGNLLTKIGWAGPTTENGQTVQITRSAPAAHGATGWSLVSGSQVIAGTIAEFKNVYELPLYNQVWDVESTKVDVSIASTTTISTTGYFFGISLPVPTITEEIVDLAGQYVYSPTFEMQTDPILQQYIYYSENGNLSPTFINSRPNGMYVLSTSSGSTFGAILPANLSFHQILPLANQVDGNLPLFNIDYDNPTRIMASDDPSYDDLQQEYQTLFQTVYSDKSELLANNENSLYLKEIGGSNTKLYRPSVVQPTPSVSRGIITFNLNLKTLDFTSSNLATVNYKLVDPLLPNNAVIAKTIEDYYGLPYGSNVTPYIEAYQLLLNDYINPNILPENKPDLEPVFSHQFDISNPQTGLITIGYMTSYSQVSQYYSSFLNDNYVTDYEIRLNVTYDVAAPLPSAFSHQIGTTTYSGIPSNITNLVSTTLTFNFRDTGLILPLGTNILSIGSDEMDNVTLEYYDELTSSYVFVDYVDYQLTSTLIEPVANRPFSFTITMNPNLKAGLYRVGYKLLPYLEDRTYHTFTKAGSALRAIEEIEHYSSGKINPLTTTFQTNVNFGYSFDFSSTSVQAVTNPNAKAYQSNVLYYELPFIDRIKVSDFSTITNVVINNTTFNAQGFRIYNISYTVRAENNTQTTYNHQIIERPISITDVYRNNNKVVMNQFNPVIISREAFSTSVSINYGIDPTFSSDIYNLESDNPNSFFTITPQFVNGIQFETTSNYLVFVIDNLAEAGAYTFNIGYQRLGENEINLGTLYLFKSLGTNAYLFDIQFAELATETNYAKIYVSNSSGIIDTSSIYNPTIYYAGIDYDRSDINGVTNFRVDGQVSNIPLDEYIPYFLNYLPQGATVSRKTGTSSYTQEVSGPFDPNVSVLAADFTSAEGIDENDDIIITYRVTSEDGLNQVYYHITVTDVTYNVSYIFDVVYIGNDLKPNLNGNVIVINVRNMRTNLPVTDTIVTELPIFNTVVSYENSTNLFYMIGYENYKFRFGRNKSGFFSFNVKVLDPEGYVYDVKIELNGTDELQGVNELDVNSKDIGKYYYINSSTKNRTRNFVITISNARVPNRDYGFTYQDPSWKEVEDEG